MPGFSSSPRAATDEPENFDSNMKSTVLEAILPPNKGSDDANHNQVYSENRNGSRTKFEYKHIIGPPNLESVLRANGSLKKPPNGTHRKESSLHQFLHVDTNGALSPSLTSSKTPVIVVKTVSDLNGTCTAENVSTRQDERIIQDFFSMKDTAVVFPEPVSQLVQVPLTPAAVKSLSDAEGPEQGVKCPQCPAAFSGFPALQEHLEAEHPRPASPRDAAFSPLPACTPCNLSFPNKDQLEKHELLHSPNSQVSCKVCNKQFANVYRLQRHMISHDESAVLRKFKCPECEKAFKFKHHLKEHIRIHSGEKPFECKNCGKKFSHSGSYSSHMTSKKCLVMNLKVSRGRALGLDKSPLSRGLVKRANGKGNFQLGPGNGVFPMMPKYGDAAMFPAVSPRSSFVPPSSTPTLHPFYMAAAPTMPPLNPYSLPALTHFLEQLATPMTPKKEIDEGDHVRTIKEEMKEEEDVKMEDRDEKDRSSPQSTTGSDLEAVKRILETVNATVTKQLLQANMHKFTSSPSESSSVSPSSESLKDEIECRHCGKAFRNRIDHHQHERYLCDSLSKSEGLAAKLEDVASDKSANGGGSSDEDDVKDGDMEEEGVAITTQEGADGRKVRVRSLIADEHLAILKHHYMLNARPKREELSRIAEKIGFPVRVVQVWFQNTRARDRREGRLMQVPYLPLFPNNVPLLTTALEQPLDLSTKKARGDSPSHPGEIEAMNLSRRPLSPRPHTFPNGLPGRRTPSPLAYLNLHQDDITPGRLNRLLTHPGHMSMERFFSSDLQVKSPLTLGIMENGRASSSSPGSDKRSWRQGDMTSETEDSVAAEAGAFEDAKRGRFLLGNGYPMSDTEIEGQFICDQCDKAFSKQSSLARHKYEHSGQRPHKCEVCDKAFKHKHHLTEHRRLHSGEKPFQCSKCLKKFSHSGSYSQHMNHRYSYCKPYRE